MIKVRNFLKSYFVNIVTGWWTQDIKKKQPFLTYEQIPGKIILTEPLHIAGFTAPCCCSSHMGSFN